MHIQDIVIGWVRKTADGDTDELIELEARDKGEIIDWHRIVARNDTSADTLIEVGLKRNNDVFLVRAAAQGAAGRTVQSQADFPASGDYHPYAVFSDPSAGDILELFGYGHVKHCNSEPEL